MTLTDNQIKELNEYYYNPSTGLLNEMQLYYVFKPKGYKFKDIHEFYQKQKINQIYKPFNRKKVYYHSIIGKDGDYQADLMFLKQFKSQSNNYEGILTIIDITSTVLAISSTTSLFYFTECVFLYLFKLIASMIINDLFTN